MWGRVRGRYHACPAAGRPRRIGEVAVEIRDWLRASGDRVRLLVVIPLAAALIAALIGTISPARYRATATVILPGISSTGPLTSVTAQRVADFSAAVRSDGALDEVASQLEIDRSTLDTITVTRSGSSGVLAVSFVGTDPERCAEIAEAAARLALRLQAQVNKDAAAAAAEAAGQLYAQEDEAYQQAELKAGFLYSDAVLAEFSRRYNDAVDALNAAKASGSQTAIAQAQAVVDQRGAKLTDAQGLQTLSSARLSALSVLSNAKARLAAAEGDLISAQTLTIPTTRAIPLSKSRFVIQRVVLSALFGLALAVALLVLLQLLQVRQAGGPAGVARRPAVLGERRGA